MVGYGAGADQGTRRQRARSGGMGEQLVEAELHVLAAFGLAEELLFVVGNQGAVNLATAPGVTELIRRHRHRREGRARLARHEAEPLAELRRNEVAQRHVVDQYQQANVRLGRRSRGAHGHVVGDDPHLGLEIDAEFLAGHGNGFTRPQETVRGRLIHEGIGEKAGGHLGAARLAHALDVGQVGAAVEELVGPRQGARQGPELQRKGLGRLARVQCLVGLLERR